MQYKVLIVWWKVRQHWTPKQRTSVLWNDESCLFIWQSNEQVCICQLAGEQQLLGYIVANIKFCSEEIMAWDYFTGVELGLHIFSLPRKFGHFWPLSVSTLKSVHTVGFIADKSFVMNRLVQKKINKWWAWVWFTRLWPFRDRCVWQAIQWLTLTTTSLFCGMSLLFMSFFYYCLLSVFRYFDADFLGAQLYVALFWLCVFQALAANCCHLGYMSTLMTHAFWWRMLLSFICPARRRRCAAWLNKTSRCILNHLSRAHTVGSGL